MKTVTVIIERTENNFSAYVKDVDGVVAVGNSIDEIKSRILEAVDVYKDSCREFGVRSLRLFRVSLIFALSWISVAC